MDSKVRLSDLVREWQPRFEKIVAALADIDEGGNRRTAAKLLRNTESRLRRLAISKTSQIAIIARYNLARAEDLEAEEILIPIRQDFVDLTKEIDQWNIDPTDWSAIKKLSDDFKSPRLAVMPNEPHVKIMRRRTGGAVPDYRRYAAILIAAELWEKEKKRPPTASTAFARFCRDVFEELGLADETDGLEDLIARMLKRQGRKPPTVAS